MRSFHRIKKEIGLEVLKKYNNKCTKCGSNENLCVHHIIPMKINDIRYNDIDNLTILCSACHMSHHRVNGDITPPSPPSGNPYGRRGKNPPIKCSEQGCERYQHGRALCKKHYEYKRRRGLL